VRRRLFERLQQRRFGATTQHVHLVEDEHTMATRVAHRCTLNEFANVVDAVVARRIELEHVETGAPLDGQARLALTTRLPFVGCGAIEHFGKDARRRCLARAARPRKEVRLSAAVVGHRVAQGPHDVFLTLQFAESARAIAAVQRLGGHFVASLPLGCTAQSAQIMALCAPE